jgi:exosome complex exonuclease RRP6
VAHILTNLVCRYVLPNHHLFTVAERSPSNVAQLLGLFSHGAVPPVLRRRAGELTEVIKATVERVTSSGLTVEAITDAVDVKTANSAASTEIIIVEKIPKSKLWGSTKVSSSSVLQRASSSSLFGPRSTVVHEGSSYSTSQSSLFGAVSSHSPPQVSRLTHSHAFVIRKPCLELGTNSFF